MHGQRETRGVEKVTQALLVVSDGVQFADDRLVEVVSIPGREIGQAVVLQPGPHWLHRHPHRCVSWQPLQIQPPVGLAHQFIDRTALCILRRPR